MKADPAAQLRLLDLQELDTKLSQLAHKKRNLPEGASLAESERAMAATRDKHVAVSTEVADLEREQAKAEADVELVRARARKDQALMDSGAVNAAKQLEELQHEVASLARRQAALEEVELEVMERLEGAQARLVDAATARESAARANDSAKAAFEAAVRDIDMEAERVRVERTRVAADIPGDLGKLYDKLRVDIGGTGAAALYRGACQGCRMQLTPVDIGRLRDAPAEDVVRCEECRRILVRTAESGL